MYATGGTITQVNGKRIHKFLATETNGFVVTEAGYFNVLVVAGGGGGGAHLAGGGGGGGGILFSSAFLMSATSYTVTIGGGGGSGANGGNSVLSSLTAIGGGAGGGGGAWNAGVNGAAGGSGGGASGEYYNVKTGGGATSGQGNIGGNSRTYANGAYAGGGGGGYGAAGAASVAAAAGNGGAGYGSIIGGSMQYYGAGGGGSVYRESGSVAKGTGGSGVGGNGQVNGIAYEAATSGATNTGSGGGGVGGNGGSGIVIISYPIEIPLPTINYLEEKRRIRLPIKTKPTQRTQNIAHKKVAVSSNGLITALITDNDINTANYFGSGSGSLQYIQIDLSDVFQCDYISLWHYYADTRTYYFNKTEVSIDGSNWTTIYDSEVSGRYAESASGANFSFTMQPVRYVRNSVNGSSVNTGNHWVELKVYGLPK